MLLMTFLPLAGWAATNLAAGWTIKLSAPLETYQAKNLLPEVSLTDGNSTITSGFNVVWKNENGVVVTEAVNVGWYEATVTADMTNTYGELKNPTMKFWILKATPSVKTAGVVLTSVAYDGKEHALVTTAPVYNLGTVEYSIDNNTWNTAIPKGKKVGVYDVHVRVQGTDNWNPIASFVLGSPEITGKKIDVDADFTAPTAETGLKFTNKDQALIKAGAVKTEHVKELQYKVGSGEWSTTIPTAKNAGDYQVYYKAVGGDGYYDYEAPSFKVTIAPDAPTLTAPVGAQKLTYTGEDQELIATAATATLGAPVKYIVNFMPANALAYAGYGAAAEKAKGTDAGTYKVKSVVEAGGNYTYAESDEIEVTVAQAKAFATDADKPKAADLTWNNKAQQLIKANPVKTGIVKYRLGSTGDFNSDIDAMQGTTADDYTVQYKVINPNYEGYDVINTVADTKIKKKVLSVKVDDIEKTYNGNTTIDPAPGYTFIGRIADGLDFSGVKVSATEMKNVGEYVGELTVAKTALEGVSTNYDYTIIPGKLTIKPVEVTISVNPDNKKLTIIYGQNPDIAKEYDHSTLVTGEGLNDVFSKLPVLTTNAAAVNPSIGTYTLSFTPGVLKNGGNYVMSTAGEKGDGYVIGAANFVVKPQADQKIVITVLPQTHKYTGVAEDFSTMKAGVNYYVSGLLDNDELSKAPTFSRSNPTKFNVGTYDLIASGAEISAAIANKYPGGIVYNNSTLEITAKELVATVNTQTVQVGAVVGDLNGDAWSVEGLENGEAKSVLGGTLALKSGATASVSDGIDDGIILSITNKNYTLKKDTEYGKLIVIPAGALGLSDAPTNDNFTKIKAFDKSTNVTVKMHLSNRAQKIGSSTFTWGAKEYQILVLPFDVTVSEISRELGYAVVNVVNKDKATADNIYWSLEWGTIPANTPFTVRTAEAIPDDGIDLTFTTKEIKAPETAYPSVDAGNGFKVVGAYEAYTIDKSSASKERFYAGGKHYGIGADSDKTWTINPFNGYVDLSGSAAAPESVTFTFENVDGGTTAIRSITAENAGNAKAEGWYTLNGVKLQGAPVEKGVYIKNGKKIVIK